MNTIRIKCPAKINLTLEVVNKRADGFHNINSIMQLISLYDYLTISLEKSSKNSIVLSGTSNEIPYDETNLVYKAAILFLDKTGIKNHKIIINIEKHIPVAAGLAGGSTDAAGTLFGLNLLFDNVLSKKELHELCAKLGSDLNVCLEGGCILATSRGEIINKLPDINYAVSLIKPKFLGISAKEAYTKYSKKEIKPQNNMTEKMIQAIQSSTDISSYLYNDLEYAVYDDYEELQFIKEKLPNSIMSGSGSAYFTLNKNIGIDFPDEYLVIEGLNFISGGVESA